MARPALAASRAIDILNFLASRPDETFSLSELARRTGVNVASTHAIVTTLTQAGYLARDPDRRSYSLGASVIALGAAAIGA
ncbi:MAG: helix-turn-helix domain-containing protein, partial [Acidimicrobiales bacterium]|nr:helix-turn-helix domain-containing protein [Acidimicrobiales bacterium]